MSSIQRTRLRLRLALMSARRFRHRGEAVFCPVCDRSFARFLPFGEGPAEREAAECPNCHALERTRLLTLYLEHQEPAFEPTSRSPKLLHMAPEPGLQKKLRRRLGDHYTTADLYWPLVDDRVDIHALPYGNATFDLILCAHVLAHVHDDLEALAELQRVLKPAGALLLQSQVFDHAATLEAGTHSSPQERASTLGHATRFRNYGRDHTPRIESAGFHVQTIDYVTAFTPEERTRFGLGGLLDAFPGPIYRCTKPDS